MAEVGGYTVLAVYPHRDTLEKYEYIIRKNYKSWRLNPDALRDPLLTAVLSLNVELYREDGIILARKRA